MRRKIWPKNFHKNFWVLGLIVSALILNWPIFSKAIQLEGWQIKSEKLPQSLESERTPASNENLGESEAILSLNLDKEETPLADEFLAKTLELINEARQNNNLKPLKINPLLSEAALLKANDMSENNYFSHYSPTGVSPWYWFKKVNYSYEIAGENLAADFETPQTMVSAWLNSTTHKANILNSQYTETGLAKVFGNYKGKKAMLVVQLFAKPLYTVDQKIEVIVKINSPLNYNASQAKIYYSNENLELESINFTNSAFAFNFSNEDRLSGLIEIYGLAPFPGLLGENEWLRLSFRVKSSGPIKIWWGNNLKVLANDGLATEIKAKTIGDISL